MGCECKNIFAFVFTVSVFLLLLALAPSCSCFLFVPSTRDTSLSLSHPPTHTHKWNECRKEFLGAIPCYIFGCHKRQRMAYWHQYKVQKHINLVLTGLVYISSYVSKPGSRTRCQFYFILFFCKNTPTNIK